MPANCSQTYVLYTNWIRSPRKKRAFCDPLYTLRQFVYGERLPQGLWPAQRMRFLAQNQKSRLEYIFGIMFILEGAQRDAQDHRPVTANNSSKRRLIVLAHESLEQLLVGPRARFNGAYELPYALDQMIVSLLFHRGYQAGTVVLTFSNSSSSTDRNGGTNLGC